MMRPIISVFLNSQITGFRMTPEIFCALTETLPQFSFVNHESQKSFLDSLKESAAVIVWHFEESWYSTAPHLCAVFTPAAGRDWIAADPSGRVKNVHGTFHGRMISESVVGSILYFNRLLHVASVNQAKRHWDRNPYSSSTLLSNQTVLFVGYGNIGRACADKLKPFGCRLMGIRKSADKNLDDNGVTIGGTKSLADFASQADHIVAILPEGKETDGIFSRNIIDKMRDGIFFHNVGRGNSIAECDIIYALDKGKFAGAALDVFASEPLAPASLLWERKNVLITPHASCIYHDYMYLYCDELVATIPLVMKEV